MRTWEDEGPSINKVFAKLHFMVSGAVKFVEVNLMRRRRSLYMVGSIGGAALRSSKDCILQ